MKRSIFLFERILLFLVTAIFVGCATPPKPPQFTLTEVGPDLSKLQPVVAPPVNVPKVLVLGKIVQIIDVNGIQKYVYLLFGNPSNKLKPGLMGDIFADASLAQKIGKCKLIESEQGFYKAVVTELYYRLTGTSVVQFDITGE